MILIYYILIWIAYFVMAIPILLLSFFKNKYKISLKSRFFLYKNFIREEVDVHFHACSFGEVRTINNLVDKFNSRISVITQTGYEEAKKKCGFVNYLAFENFIPFWFKKCKILVVFEAEYWLMLFFIAKLKGAKIIILNARISDKSFKKYLYFSFFYKKIFSYVDCVIAQSQNDKDRLSLLGAKNIFVDKNLKSYIKVEPNKKYNKIKEKLIIFASTHKHEEELLLSNFNLKKTQKLIIAPRHPERFLEVENILKKYNLDYDKFSSLDDFSKFNKNIMLLDVLGELVNFYAISDIVFLGGSFVKNIGGHNPIEVASFDNVLISGIYIDNQKSLYQEVENVVFCDDLSKINNVINNHKLKKAKLKENHNLDNIISIIKRNLDARKSL